MDLSFGIEYTNFREEVKDFIDQHQDKQPSATTESMSAIEWQKLLIDNGYHSRTIPREYGGFGAEPDIIKSRIIAEEFSRARINTGLGGQGISMLVPVLLEMGSEEQKQQFVRTTIGGEMVWCQGYSEPGAGSDLASLTTKAELDGDEWVINGQKIWTSTAQYSQMMFCLVRTEPDAQKHAGISYLLVPMDTPGLEIRPLVDMTLKAGFNEVFFTDVTIPKENIIGKRGEGWAVANATLGHERGSLTDPNATVNRVNFLIDRMKEERLDGTRLIDMPVYRDKLISIQAKVMAFQSNSLRVLSSKLNQGQDTKIAGMIQKLVGTELRHELEGFAVDIMGEVGTLYEDSPHLRDSGSWQFLYMYYLGLIIGGGTSQIQKNIISERGLGMPREPKTQGV